LKIWYSGISHGHRCYTEKENPDILIPKIPVLMSYFYEPDPKPLSFASEVFFDSGAFSAKSSGKPITLDEFISTCLRIGHRFSVIAALDVIGNPEQSWENYLAMLEAGLQPLPTVHHGAPLSEFAKYFDKTDYVAIGGIAGLAAGARHQFLSEIFAMYPDRSAHKFHGFGVSSMEMMLEYPWHSIDSSSPDKTAIFGAIYLPKAHTKLTVAGRGKAFEQKQIDSVLEELTSIGIEPDIQRMLDPALNGRLERLRINILVFEYLKSQTPETYTQMQGRLF
jgi:hypothetical protein